MTEETEQQLWIGKQYGIKYDETVKELFMNKEIIAPILKYTVPEYDGYSVDQVIQYIEADSITDQQPVSDIPMKIGGSNTEESSLTDKVIYYDIHFKAANPALSNKTITVMLHIDFEIQNKYYPTGGYPIEKRAVYYVARELCSQLGKLTNQTNYKALQKAYSIWICNEDVPNRLQNTVTRYSMTKEDFIGFCNEPKENYDLMEVILIRRGKQPIDSDIFQYLEAIFCGNLQQINQYVDIHNNHQVKKEVKQMSGLWESIYHQAIQQGQEQGLEQGRTQEREKRFNMLYMFIKNHLLTFEDAIQQEEEKSAFQDWYQQKAAKDSNVESNVTG